VCPADHVSYVAVVIGVCCVMDRYLPVLSTRHMQVWVCPTWRVGSATLDRICDDSQYYKNNMSCGY
jgi:hypothetical protein